MSPAEYWKECIEEAAAECGAELSQEQIEYLADVVEGAHENYGQAFYSPPPSDQIAEVEREFRAKLEAETEKTERIRRDFVNNVCLRRGCSPSDVILEEDGYVTIK
jgi:hypothetical protein